MADNPRGIATFVDELDSSFPADTVFRPGTDGYSAATRPKNTSFVQRPDAVVRPRSADQVAATIRAARKTGLRVAVQSTGHGSGHEIGRGVVLIDTHELNNVEVTVDTASVLVGAGATWSQVQAQAEPHGLLALSGTSANVGICGYIVGGGIGWLARPYGLASSSLRAVHFVDGTGRLHRATPDSPDPIDRDALWAFRGGAAVGIATELEFDLFLPGDLSAGYVLWPADSKERIEALARTWTTALKGAPATLTSTFSLLHLPPAGPFPEPLLGTTVVHLSYASTDGPGPLNAMRDAMATVAPPAVDATGSSTASVLMTIHLDPPLPVPARGAAWWAPAEVAEHMSELLAAADVGAPNGLNMIEIRHVDSDAAANQGALTRAPQPFLVHAVGAAVDDLGRAVVDRVLDRVAAVLGPNPRSMPSFCEGQADAGNAHTQENTERLVQIARQLDPGQVLLFQRGTPGTDHTLPTQFSSRPC